MKRSLLAAVGMTVCVMSALAQAPNALAPSSVTPKTIPPEATPQPKLEVPRSPRPNPAGDKPIIADKPTLAISAIIIVKSRAEVQENLPPGTTGLQVRGIPFLTTPEFRNEVQHFVGKLLTENPDQKMWLQNLLKSDAQFLLVGRQSVLTNPPERAFADSDPAHFLRVNETESGALYQIKR